MVGNNIKSSGKEFDLLVLMAGQFFTEVWRLKELRWKITVLIVSMLLGINTFLIISELHLGVWLSWIIIAISFLVYIYGTVSLYLVEIKLMEELAALRHCREKLGALTNEILCGSEYESKTIEKLEHKHSRRIFMTLGLYVAITLSLGANILYICSKGFVQ